MNITYIGGGFVGTCSAAVTASSGHTVLVYDIDAEKIKKLNSRDRDVIKSCLFEDGLDELLLRHQDRISFTSDKNALKIFLETAQVIFMCLPTPELGETGESDLQFYKAAAHDVAQLLVTRGEGSQQTYVVIVNKSTVPIEMSEMTGELFSSEGVRNFGVVSNPEFLVEGQAIQGSLQPDRVVVGASKEQDFIIMREVYQRFFDSPTIQYLEVNPREAAAGKLLANFYLFNRLAVCFNVIGRTCENFNDIRFESIRRILTSDPRIGSWGFQNSLYAGGSCFIKDARSLAFQLHAKNVPIQFINETYLANKQQLSGFISRATAEGSFEWKGKSIALLGVAFKRDTNDIRNSPAVDIIRYALDHSCRELKIYDPVASSACKINFPESAVIKYVAHEFEAIKNADLVIIATDWPQFAGVADMLIAGRDRSPLIMDGRRILQHRYDDLRMAGFTIIAVGSPMLKPFSVTL